MAWDPQPRDQGLAGQESAHGGRLVCVQPEPDRCGGASAGAARPRRRGKGRQERVSPPGLTENRRKKGGKGSKKGAPPRTKPTRDATDHTTAEKKHTPTR